MSEPGEGAWLELTDAQLRVLVPFTIRAEGLAPAAVREVRQTFRTMALRGLAAFTREMERVPDEREAELLARAVVAHLNSVTIPLIGGAGDAHATLQ